MSTKPIFPNIWANIIYDKSGINSLQSLIPRNDGESVLDKDSLRMLSTLHSREDNMFVCVDKRIIKANEGDVIVVTDKEWSHENDCYSRCYHVVTKENIQYLNVFHDSISNGQSLKYYLFQGDSVSELIPSNKMWNQSGHGTTPKKPLSMRLGQKVTVDVSQKAFITKKYNGYVEMNKRIQSKRKNYTTTNIDYTAGYGEIQGTTSQYLQFGVNPYDYAFSKTILVDMQWTTTAADFSTMGTFMAGDVVIAFYQPKLADGTSSWVPNLAGQNTTSGPLGAAQCRGVTVITQAMIDKWNASNTDGLVTDGSGVLSTDDTDRTNDTYKVPVIIYMNDELAENFYFGVRRASNPNQIILYKSSVFEPYRARYYDSVEPDNLYCHPIARPGVDMNFSSIKAGQWLWFSKPFGSGSLDINTLEYYVGDVATGQWDVIKTQTDIVYKVGGAEYGTKSFSDISAQNTFFNIHFALDGVDKTVEMPDGFTSAIVPHDTNSDGLVTDEVYTEHIYTWAAYNNLIDSTVTSEVDGYLRSQFNFEQIAGETTPGDPTTRTPSQMKLQPGQGYKFYPFTTSTNELALQATTASPSPDQGVAGITDTIADGTYLTDNVEDASGTLGVSVLTDIVTDFDTVAGLEKDKFTATFVSGEITAIANANLTDGSDNDPTWNYSATPLTQSDGTTPINDVNGNQVQVYVAAQSDIQSGAAFSSTPGSVIVEGYTRDVYSMGGIVGEQIKTYGLVNQISTTFGVDMDYALAGVSVPINPIYFVVSRQRTGNTVLPGSTDQFTADERSSIGAALMEFLRDPSYLTGKPDPKAAVLSTNTSVDLGTWMVMDGHNITAHFNVNSNAAPLDITLANAMINTSSTPIYAMGAVSNTFNISASGLTLMSFVGDDSDTTQLISTVDPSAVVVPSGGFDFSGDGRSAGTPGSGLGWEFYYTTNNLYLTYNNVVQQINFGGIAGAGATLSGDTTLVLEIVPNNWVFQVEPDAANTISTSTTTNVALLNSTDGGANWTELYSLGGPAYVPTSYIEEINDEI